MDLPGTREGRYEAGGADDADSKRNGTRPDHLELPYPRPAFDVQEGTLPLVLTGRGSLVTTSRNHRGFDAKNARMATELLWPKKELAW
jgi:hypothetical protein